jgi:hypothetical protein
MPTEESESLAHETLERATLNLTQDARSIFLLSHRFCQKPVPTFWRCSNLPVMGVRGGARPFPENVSV